MKKTFKLEDLDCPNCAAKLERTVQKTEGVISASVNFMMLKLTVEAEDSEFDEVMQNEPRGICNRQKQRTYCKCSY